MVPNGHLKLNEDIEAKNSTGDETKNTRDRGWFNSTVSCYTVLEFVVVRLALRVSLSACDQINYFFCGCESCLGFGLLSSMMKMICAKTFIGNVDIG